MKKILIFDSTRAVIKAEQQVRGNGIACRIIPVPRSVSPQCGMALEIDEISIEPVTKLVNELKISVKIFDRDKVRL